MTWTFFVRVVGACVAAFGFGVLIGGAVAWFETLPVRPVRHRGSWTRDEPEPEGIVLVPVD